MHLVHPLAFAFFSMLVACATTPRQSQLWSEDQQSALLYHDAALEIRVSDGRVEVLHPPSTPGGQVRVRTIDDIDELREIYASTDQSLRERTDGRSIEVNGWVGLECVRRGETCGPPPREPVPVMIVLRCE
jgi:hypothetical protein